MIEIIEVVMKKTIGLILLLGFASITQASDSFIVNAKIYENDIMIDSPTLLVNSDKEASISVEVNKSGQDHL